MLGQKKTIFTSWVGPVLVTVVHAVTGHHLGDGDLVCSLV